MVEGHKENGKFHPHGSDKPGVHSSSVNHSTDSHPGSVKTGKTLSQEEFVAQVKDEATKEESFDSVVKRIESEWKIALNEDEDLPHVDWDVSLVYTGSWGSANEEHFTATAFGKGIGDVEYSTAFSSDNWIPEYDDEGNDSTKYEQKLQNDDAFAEKEYNNWLRDTLDAHEDSIYESLVDTIKSTYSKEGE